MKTRNFDIANLQPTEMPRESSQSYLEGLRLEEIKLKHGPLQVWEIDKILCIADGNQRTINAEKKGETRIEATHFHENDLPEYMSEELELVKSRLKEMNEKGIYTIKQTYRA